MMTKGKNQKCLKKKKEKEKGFKNFRSSIHRSQLLRDFHIKNCDHSTKIKNFLLTGFFTA
jgi:hypothetical protein